MDLGDTFNLLVQALQTNASHLEAFCRAMGAGSLFFLAARHPEDGVSSIQSAENDQPRVLLLYIFRYYKLQEA